VSEGPEWFAPKRYGYGSGFPIRWEGWLLLAGFLAAAFAVSAMFDDKPLVATAIIVPLTAVFLVICARTTRGGWRWRWGDED
jgi:hypothetical protein